MCRLLGSNNIDWKTIKEGAVQSERDVRMMPPEAINKTESNIGCNAIFPSQREKRLRDEPKERLRGTGKGTYRPVLLSKQQFHRKKEQLLCESEKRGHFLNFKGEIRENRRRIICMKYPSGCVTVRLSTRPVV